MKAVVFAAGLGTRLYPITKSMPKALVEVGGKSMLQRVLEKLESCGITQVVVNIHHFPDMIVEYLKTHDNFGLDVMISDERDKLLDTGGGVLKASKFLKGDEPVILHNADILTDFDLRSMIRFHELNNPAVSLLVSERKSSRLLLFDNDMKMKGWTNISTGEVRPCNLDYDGLGRFAFGGVHIISPEVLDRLAVYGQANPVFSIVPFYVAQCEKIDIRGYIPEESYTWFDVGKPETLENARQFIGK